MNYAMMDYAGFWRRAGAMILDGIIISVISLFFKMIGLNSLGLDVLLALMYDPFFNSSELQATPGKALLNMRVISMTGERITFKKAIIRYLVRIVSGLLLCIGFLMMLFTEKKQTLHDLAAETLVVRGEVKNVNYFQAWYQQVLQVLGMVDKIPTKPKDINTSIHEVTPSDLAGLYELYQKGILTEEEYKQKREELLKKL
ncbi:MAG: RDD family protein [Pseudobdellovibrionaceae bacterium]